MNNDEDTPIRALNRFLLLEHMRLTSALCDFSYACGQEAAMEGRPRVAFAGEATVEPQTLLAWEAGYDDWTTASQKPS